MKKYLLPVMLLVFIILPGCSLAGYKSTEGTAGASISEGSMDTGVDSAATQKVQPTPFEDSGLQDQAKLLLTLYYQDNEGSIVPVTRKVLKQEGVARAAILGLIDSAASREELEYFGLYPVLPEGTEVLGITIKEGIASVDFNNKLLDYEDEAAERNIISSIVYTLTEFKNVEGVRIMFNGYTKEKLKFGTDISGVLTRKNTLVNADRVNLEEGSYKLDIYLFKHIKDGFLYMLPVSVKTENKEVQELPDEIIKLLRGHFFSERLTSEIPPETGLISSSLQGNVITLDFNGHITEYGGSSREEAIIKQILYSMKQIDGVEKVKLKVDGKGSSLPEGTDISREIAIPAAINDFIDR